MQGPNEAVEEVQELEHLSGPLSSIPASAADEEPIPPVLITETRASVDEPVMTETLSRSEGNVIVSELSETCDDVEASGALVARETPQTFPVLEEPQKIANKKSVHVSLTSFLIPDSMHSGQACLPSMSSTPPKSLKLAPSASIFPPTMEPTATDWSPRPLLVSSLVDGSPLHPRFLKRVAHRSTLQLENSSISPQSKTLQPLLQPLPSPPLSRKTRKRSLVGAQSCERQGLLPYASEFLKLIIVFIIFVLVLYFTFYHA